MQELRDFHLGEDADGVVHLPDPSAEQSQRQRAHYYANVTLIDNQVGEIIKSLEQRGVMEGIRKNGTCISQQYIYRR